MNSWTSYPKLWNLGHPQVSRLLDKEVRVEEKIDGSQFSFGVIDGELKFKSKRVEMFADDVQKLFKPAVETVTRLHQDKKLVPGWTYRAEAMYGPKHNTLAYDRAPAGGLILFDIATGPEAYASRLDLERVGVYLGLEVVPLMFTGKVTSFEQLEKLLDTVSVLGGQKIEGVVLKGGQFCDDGKPMYGKFVSERFKELNNKDFKERNPAQGDIIESLKIRYRTEARWDKAVQHLSEAGQLTNTPKDIGLLMKEVGTDLQEECAEEIKELLFKWAWGKIQRGVTGGLPQWYKEKLAKKTFND